jgi:transposase, IS30 family
MRSYQQLTREQRYQIYALLKMGHNQTEIAQTVGMHKATISRELGRNTGQRGYRPRQAQHLSQERRKKGQPRIDASTWQVVEEKLQQDWSPEQVSGWLAKNKAIRISHEWIYQHVYADFRAGGKLHQHLRSQKKRRKRLHGQDRRGQLTGRRSIEERPAIVDDRSRIGDWEVDTLIGKQHQQAIVTLTERKSRFALLGKVSKRSAEQVQARLVQLMRPFLDKLNTMTGDNGKEFAQHELLAVELDMDFFFAHPYASWERGSNENMNGLVRQYLPKKTDFSQVTNADLVWIMDRLNLRPRKCLGFRTPFEVFFDLPVALDT